MVHEQGLGPVHIAHPGDDGLIHQQLPDRLLRFGDAGHKLGDIGIFSQGIGAEAGGDRLIQLVRAHIACRRPTEVDGGAMPDDTQTYRTDRIRGGKVPVHAELSEETQMDVD